MLFTVIQSGYNFAHTMTAELSWHVQNYDLIRSLDSDLVQKYFSQDLQLWAHKWFVKMGFWRHLVLTFVEVLQVYSIMAIHSG